MNGNPLRSLEVDLPANSLAGIEVGPDDKLWFVDMETGKLYRIDPPTE
jgi:sugar lactone lactonase YvrE